ncbi:hypothetical protein EV421DRAFT_1933776 [Armillaria borealis]|uniref:Uncharacterized protein n=1 Tax=Armillaria borealis TaxID=47425 RepID=A0AA39MEA6_9AGAR|nr:hypothetical protein EV421DRAFT_1933776 [Armillaria borealis]
MFIPHPESFSDTTLPRHLSSAAKWTICANDSLASLKSQLSVFPDALSPSSQLNEQTTGTPFSFESVFGSYYELYATSASALSIEGPERKVLQELHLVDADDGGADRKRVRWNTEVAEFTIELCKKVKMLEPSLLTIPEPRSPEPLRGYISPVNSQKSKTLSTKHCRRSTEPLSYCFGLQKLPMRTSQVAPVLIMDYDGVSLDDNSDEENNNEGDGTGMGTRAIVAGNVERDLRTRGLHFQRGQPNSTFYDLLPLKQYIHTSKLRLSLLGMFAIHALGVARRDIGMSNVIIMPSAKSFLSIDFAMSYLKITEVVIRTCVQTPEHIDVADHVRLCCKKHHFALMPWCE